MNKRSFILSAALAGILSAGSTAFSEDTKPMAENAPAAAAKSDKVDAKKTAEPMGECHNMNGCKGKGECGGAAGNSCKGSNGCKGKGWVSMKKKACEGKKGEWQEKKM